MKGILGLIIFMSSFGVSWHICQIKTEIINFKIELVRAIRDVNRQ